MNPIEESFYKHIQFICEKSSIGMFGSYILINKAFNEAVMKYKHLMIPDIQGYNKILLTVVKKGYLGEIKRLITVNKADNFKDALLIATYDNNTKMMRFIKDEFKLSIKKKHRYIIYNEILHQIVQNIYSPSIRLLIEWIKIIDSADFTKKIKENSAKLDFISIKLYVWDIANEWYPSYSGNPALQHIDKIISSNMSYELLIFLAKEYKYFKQLTNLKLYYSNFQYFKIMHTIADCLPDKQNIVLCIDNAIKTKNIDHVEYMINNFNIDIDTLYILAGQNIQILTYIEKHYSKKLKNKYNENKAFIVAAINCKEDEMIYLTQTEKVDRAICTLALITVLYYYKDGQSQNIIKRLLKYIPIYSKDEHLENFFKCLYPNITERLLLLTLQLSNSIELIKFILSIHISSTLLTDACMFLIKQLPYENKIPILKLLLSYELVDRKQLIYDTIENILYYEDYDILPILNMDWTLMDIDSTIKLADEKENNALRNHLINIKYKFKSSITTKIKHAATRTTKDKLKIFYENYATTFHEYKDYKSFYSMLKTVYDN